MFPLPFQFTAYSLASLKAQISIDSIVLSHIPTVVIPLAFAIFLYWHTKKISTLYLLFATIAFSLWTYFDLITWTSFGVQNSLMFSWSILDIFSTLFIVFAYWFFYSFIKGADLPLWQKLGSLCFLIPPLVYTALSINLSEFFNSYGVAIENDYTASYSVLISVIFLLAIIVITTAEYRKTQEATEKTKKLFAGFATGIFLSIFSISYAITNLLLFLSNGQNQEAYNVSIYALFSMPFLTGVLAYLVVKYEAFNIKVIKSIVYTLICMAILFVNIFLPY
jgi:hypothetical protein